MPEPSTTGNIRAVVRLALRAVMTLSAILLLVMAYNLYYGYASIRGVEGIAAALLVAIPSAVLLAAYLLHRWLKR